MRIGIAGTAVLALSLAAGSVMAFDAGSSCVKCHGDREKMESLGAGSMYLDPAAVDREVGMNGAPSCTDCHQGDPASMEKGPAHIGLLRPFVTAAGKKVKGEAVFRSDIGLSPLLPGKQGSPMTAMIPKGGQGAAPEERDQEDPGDVLPRPGPEDLSLLAEDRPGYLRQVPLQRG